MKYISSQNISFFFFCAHYFYKDHLMLRYKPICITFIPLYLVFCYILCVNWVNNVAFHDLGVKIWTKDKNCAKTSKNDTKGKMVISHKKWKIVSLESLMNFKHARLNSEIFMKFTSSNSSFNIAIKPN